MVTSAVVVRLLLIVLLLVMLFLGLSVCLFPGRNAVVAATV